MKAQSRCNETECALEGPAADNCTVAYNEEPQNEESRNEKPQNEESQNEKPQNEELQNEKSQNEELQNEKSQNEEPREIIKPFSKRLLKRLRSILSSDTDSKNEDEGVKKLLNEIIKAKKDCDDAYHEFDFVSCNAVEYSIYRIKACQARYEYLLREAKKAGLQRRII